MIVCGNNNCQITTEILHTILGRGTRAEPAARAGDNDVARDRKELAGRRWRNWSTSQFLRRSRAIIGIPGIARDLKLRRRKSYCTPARAVSSKATCERRPRLGNGCMYVDLFDKSTAAQPAELEGSPKRPRKIPVEGVQDKVKTKASKSSGIWNWLPAECVALLVAAWQHPNSAMK